MSKGYKSTEICQGFILLCNWNQPAERFEEERTCASSPSPPRSRSFSPHLLTLSHSTLADQFSGLGIRMATDLNLHRKTIAQLPPDVSDETRVLYERELLNRERTWMYCYIIDRSCVLSLLSLSRALSRRPADAHSLFRSQRLDPDGQAVRHLEGGLPRAQRDQLVALAGRPAVRHGPERDGRGPAHRRASPPSLSRTPSPRRD